MSYYLSDIAARSTGNNTPSLLPTVSAFNTADNGILEHFAEKHDIQNSIGPNEFVQQNTVHLQSIPLQKVQQAVVFNRTETKEQERNTEPSYFSKHIEREEAEEKNSPIKNKLYETISFRIEEPSQKTTVGNVKVNRNVNEPGFVTKTVSKILPEKKVTKKQTGEKTTGKLTEIIQSDEPTPSKEQKINLSAEDESLKKNKLLPRNSRIERITPNQPDQLTDRPVQNNKMNEAAPKLFIGKIIVEILPPKLPVPQKIITRVVQSSSTDSPLKSNKLIFGLGQL